MELNSISGNLLKNKAERKIKYEIFIYNIVYIIIVQIYLKMCRETKGEKKV